MTIWRAGMPAVCVDASPSSWGDVGLELRKVYRVLRVVHAFDIAGNGGPSLCVLENDEHLLRAWAAERFRPLNDAEDDADLVARIKACRPAQVPALAQGWGRVHFDQGRHWWGGLAMDWAP